MDHGNNNFSGDYSRCRRSTPDYNRKSKRVWFRLDITDYSDLEEVLPKMLMVLYPHVLSSSLKEARSKSGRYKDYISHEEIDKRKYEEFMDMAITQNMMDVKKGRKPCGFNYLSLPKIIFPIIEEGKPLEFYLETHKSNVTKTEKWTLVDRLSNILHHEEIEHDILEDIAEMNINNLEKMEA